MLKSEYKMTITKQVLNSLIAIVGDKQLSQNKKHLENHSKDMSFHKAVIPEIVIWPKNTQEVSKILKLAFLHQIPVTAWGGGSSLEGNPIPIKAGIVINMTRMNKMIKVFAQDMQVRVQPGIIGEVLDARLKPHNLWFAPAPGSKHLATIGGMIANNAGGMYAIKYGVVADAALELEIVLADGRIIRVGNRSFKSVSGYNLKNLFIGSGGTLGIITEAVLKLRPLPEFKVAVLAAFPNNIVASITSLELLKSDINPASIEFMDGNYIHLVNKAKGANLLDKPTLLIELHGSKEVVSINLTQIKSICEMNNAVSYHEFTTLDEIRKLWEYRRALRPILPSIFPNMGILSAEVGVPVSQIPKFLDKAKKLSVKFNLQTIMFGHIGDGNFHAWAVYELNNKKSYAKAVRLNEELIRFAIDVEGTITGEHGIGIGKRKFLPIEHASSLSLMKDVKKLLDPIGILNPGKIFLD